MTRRRNRQGRFRTCWKESQRAVLNARKLLSKPYWKDIAKVNEFPESSSNILSDCQALLQALGQHFSATLSDSVVAVEELKTTSTKILTQWIPCHVEIPGNEIADDLANQGRGEQQPDLPTSFAECKAAIRRGMAELWETAFRRKDVNSIPGYLT